MSQWVTFQGHGRERWTNFLERPIIGLEIPKRLVSATTGTEKFKKSGDLWERINFWSIKNFEIQNIEKTRDKM